MRAFQSALARRGGSSVIAVDISSYLLRFVCLTDIIPGATQHGFSSVFVCRRKYACGRCFHGKEYPLDSARTRIAHAISGRGSGLTRQLRHQARYHARLGTDFGAQGRRSRTLPQKVNKDFGLLVRMDAFDYFPDEEGSVEESDAEAVKRVIAGQPEQEMWRNITALTGDRLLHAQRTK